jgi:maltooligosyltrehalose trehalohydrolase
MLFQGEEFSASAPFLYFADFDGDLGAAIRKGRAEFLHQFPSAAGYSRSSAFDDPGDVATFERCRLDLGERARHRAIYDLHRDLLRRRRELMPTLAGLDGAVLGPHAFVLRYFAGEPDRDHLLVVNLGAGVDQPSYAEPLIAPVSPQHTWRVVWSSDDPAFGGVGMVELRPEQCWKIPPDVAMLLAPAPLDERASGVRRRTA